jgi:hypothetical protein
MAIFLGLTQGLMVQNKMINDTILFEFSRIITRRRLDVECKDKLSEENPQLIHCQLFTGTVEGSIGEWNPC